ncbi:MAG: TonB-dependent receptor [Desulfobacteraceae bacterium]|nr:MAG: TonB-dependent receptor [Desulfobacteraceae bacterium]
MINKIILSTILLWIYASGFNSGHASEVRNAVTAISGTVMEKGTRIPLPDIKIYIRNTDTHQITASSITDSDGHFQCSVIPGKYTVIIAASGYDRFEEEIDAAADPESPYLFRIVPQVLNPYRIVVRQKKKKSEISKQTISPQEAAGLPGSNRDVLRSVTNLPGVNSVSVFNGYGNGIVIRGSAQEDSLFTVNEHSIPEFYHFGGFESIIEPEMIDSIDYNAGGFSAEYGNAMGGVISMNIRDPRTDRIGGYANIGFLSSSLMVEGPASEKDSFYFSLKRGFLDQYIRIAEKVDENRDNEIDFVQYPVYYDGSFLFNHHISKGNELKLININSYDTFKFTDPQDPVSERYSDTLKYTQKFSTFMGEWHYTQGNLKSILSPMATLSRLSWDQGERSYHNQEVKTFSLSEKTEYRLNQTHKLNGGVRLDSANVNLNSNTMILEKEGEISYDHYDLELKLNRNFHFFFPAIYLMDQVSIGKFTVTPGIHSFRDIYNNHNVLDPRLFLRYQVTEKTAVKTAAGQYSQIPQYDEFLEPWGTRGLKPERSIHTVAGVEHYFTDDLLIDIQAYHKKFTNLAVRNVEDDPTFYSNTGTGRSFGAEILLRHNMTDRFFGWIAYSYSVAKRKDGPDEPERYFDSDIPHNLITVVSYKPNRYWSFGFRYQYASGTPYTDLLNVNTIYDTDNNEYIPQYAGSINNKRLPSHHQIDFRIDKYWILNNVILSTYLDFRNIFQNKYVTSINYNEDYTAQEEQVSVDSEIPMIFLGMKVDF